MFFHFLSKIIISLAFKMAKNCHFFSIYALSPNILRLFDCITAPAYNHG